MSADSQRPRSKELTESLAGALRVDFGEVDLEAATRRFVEAGYELTAWLLEFLANYSELTVVWRSSRGDWENELTTSVEDALEVYRGNVTNYAKRLGRKVLPVGKAFATEERLLLDEDGGILLAGDAGIQRVANGFEDAVRSLIANSWDKTFF